MVTDAIRVIPKKDGATIEPGLLLHLSDMHDFMVADPVPDVRGWTVVLPDGRSVGEVEDLMVDTTDMVVRYFEIKLDKDATPDDGKRWVLVPASAARIDRERAVVAIDHLPTAGFAGAPRFGRRPPTAEEECAIREYFEIVEVKR